MARASQLRFCIFLVLLMLLSPTTSLGAMAIRAVARQGDLAPGGGTYIGFGVGVDLNGMGHVAFRGVLDDLSTGIFLAADNEVKGIARRGDPVPGGGTIDGSGAFAVNDADDVAFIASLAGGGQGVFVRSGLELSTIVRAGDLAPGGGVFSSFFGVALNNNGVLAFNALLDIGAQGVFVAEGGTLRVIARTGNIINTPEGYRGLLRFSGPALNNNGIVAFQAINDLSDDMVIVAGSGPFALFATTRTPVPDDPDFQYFRLYRPGINDVGTVVFYTITYGNYPYEYRARLMAARGGPPITMLQAGDTAPGGGTFRFFSFDPEGLSDPPARSVNQGGDIAFASELATGGGGLFLRDAEGLQAVVRGGDPAPDGGVFRSSYGFSAPALNDNGTMAFSAYVDGVPHPGIGVFTAAVGPPVTPEDRPKETAQGPQECVIQVGGPVNVATGNMYTQQEDLAYPSAFGRFAFTRTYNSQSNYQEPLGLGWTHSFDTEVRETRPGVIRVRNGAGNVRFYELVAGTTDTYRVAAPARDTSTLVKHPQGFTETERDGLRREFDIDGRLQVIVTREGWRAGFSFTDGQLTTVTDPGGRSLTFTYAGGRLTRVEGPGGLFAEYAYDGQGRLVSVSDAMGSRWSYSYSDASPSRLTSVRDASDHVVEEHTYDESGRVIATAAAEGVGARTLEYVDSAHTRVTDGLGRVTTYTFGVFGDLPVVTQIQGPCTCGSPDSTYEYDAQGRRIRQTDARGNSTTFEYDAEGNLVKMTDALGHVATSTFNAFG